MAWHDSDSPNAYQPQPDRDDVDTLRDLRPKMRAHADAWQADSTGAKKAASTASRYAIELHEANRRIEALEREREPMSGDLIAIVHCPSCGVRLSVEHGDDPGEVGCRTIPETGPGAVFSQDNNYVGEASDA